MKLSILINKLDEDNDDFFAESEYVEVDIDISKYYNEKYPILSSFKAGVKNSSIYLKYFNGIKVTSKPFSYWCCVEQKLELLMLSKELDLIKDKSGCFMSYLIGVKNNEDYINNIIDILELNEDELNNIFYKQLCWISQCTDYPTLYKVLINRGARLQVKKDDYHCIDKDFIPYKCLLLISSMENFNDFIKINKMWLIKTDEEDAVDFLIKNL